MKLIHLFGRLLRWLLLIFVGTVALAAAVIASIGFTTSGNQWLADRIAAQVSTPDMQVHLYGASGLLAGRFHLDSATLADTRGKFAELQGVDIAWSPLDLFRARFHAEKISAARISLSRLPMKTIESEPSNGSFSLPIEVKIDGFSLPVIMLGKALVQKDTVIGVTGAAQAVSDRIALDLIAAERDRLNATAQAKIAYAINGRLLSINGAIAEPRGGLLARLLALPGEPAVDIAVKGRGPLDNWHGAISGRVAGRDVLELTGSHTLDGEVHRVMLAGGGQLSELMPQAFRSLFAGQTTVDIDARFAASGLVDIRSGSVANDSFALTAKGELDPNGLAKLKADLVPSGQPIHVALPLASEPVTIDLNGASVALNGPFANAAVDLSASLAQLSTPDLHAGAVTLAAQSNNFNLANTSGRLSYKISAATLGFENARLAKVLQAPLTLNGNIDVGHDTVTLAQSDIASTNLGGTLSGRFDRVANAAAASFNLTLAPQGLLPPALEAKVIGRLGLSGQISATLPGSLSAQNLKLSSNLLTVVGSGSLNDGQVKASFFGDAANVADLTEAAKGKAHFTLAASGALASPQVVAQVSSPELRLGSEAIADAVLKFSGVVDPKKPGGHLTASATYRDQAVTAAADAVYADDRVSIPSLKAAIGQNTLSGALALDTNFLPSGAIDVDLADMASLAALAGQTADGALKARMTLAPVDGKIAGRLTAEGAQFSASGVDIIGPKLDLDIADVLARRAKGRVSADSLAAGASRLDAPALDVTLDGAKVDFALAGRLDDHPLDARGSLLQQDNGLALHLAALSATPRQVFVKLAQPAEIVVNDGKVALDKLTFAAGEGTVIVSGSAGKVLDLNTNITDLPLALANAFVPGLDAGGKLSARATISGAAGSPIVQFDIRTSDLATSQTRKAGLPQLALTATGRFADRALGLHVSGMLRDEPARIDADVRLEGGAVRVPAFTADIGTSHFSGTLAADPQSRSSGKIVFDVPDARALAAVFGRKAEGAVKGTIDLASDANKSSARIAATGTIRDQAIKAAVEASLVSGAIALPRVEISVGRNTIAGAMTLDSQFLPSGRLAFDLPDVGLLAALAGQKAEGNLRGTADIQSANGRINAELSADGALRDQAVTLRSTIVSDNGRISLPALNASVGVNTIKGAINLDANLMPGGQIDFDLPDLAMLADMAGRKAEGSLKGSALLQSTGNRIDAKVTATGAIRKQAVDLAGDIVLDGGTISLPSVKLAVGANTLAGGLSLDTSYLPTGHFRFDLSDIGLLAAMAGQEAKGALSGTIALRAADGKIGGSLSANGEAIQTGNIRIDKPVATLAFDDLASGNLTGHINAARIDAGASQLDALALDIGHADGRTHFHLAGTLDAAPLLMDGQLMPDNAGLKLTVTSFEAAPKQIPLKLAAPTDILIADGAARLSNLVIAAGSGSIRIDGTAGSALDLTASVKDLPMSLANAVSSDLDAQGALSANIKVTGNAGAPRITFDASAQDLATSQTRTAKLPALTVTAQGHMTDGKLSLTIASKIGTQPLHAAAEFALGAGAITIPSVKIDIGKSTLSGLLAFDPRFQPSGRLAFDIPDAAALAAIVGRKAEGAIRGTADIRSNDGVIAVKLAADGLIRKQAIKANADVSLDKGALSLPALNLTVGVNHLAGAVTLDPDLLPTGKLTFDLPDLALLAAMAGQKAEGAIQGKADIASESGKTDVKIAATGLIRKQAIDIDLQAILDKGAVSLPSLSMAIGKNRLTGALTLDAGYLPTGKLDFDLPDIGLIAALVGQNASGSILGSANLTSTDGKLGGTIAAHGERVTAMGVEIAKPMVDVKIADLTAAQISGKITADRIASGANALGRLALQFDRSGQQTAFDLQGQFDGAPLIAKGAVADQSDGMSVSIEKFSAAPRKIPVKLQKPTTIRFVNGAVAVTGMQIIAGKGTIAITGAAGGKLDLTAKITALPASLANAFAPSLDAAGTISATITAKGDPAAPAVAFDIDWRNAAVAQTRSAGLANFSVTAKGQMANNVVSLNAGAKGASGLSLSAGGTIGLAGKKALNLKVNGRMPFAALGPLLARQGVDLKGDASFDLSVSGSATSPAVSGRISTSGATLTVIRQNLTIKSLAATVVLDGQQARIASVTGDLSGGGTISASGTIGIAPNSGFPADIRIALKNAVYTDGKVVAAKLSGDLTVTGSLVRNPTLGGKITVRRADITIPQKLPGTLAQIDIKHRHAPRDVIVQAEKIRENRPGTKTGKNTGGLSMDLTIMAQRQIFVRGRGLDAELGGKVTIAGTSAAPIVTGGFTMRRGRLSIVGRRLDFTDGKITFAGNLSPALDFTATSTVDATTISVIIAGLANDPSVSFSSSPALPQDEVLALLIFGRNSAQLSPVQIAQLADAVSTLAGGTSNSLFNRLRQGLGVDDLDVGTDENGKSNVSVGKYLNKRTYLQLQQGVDTNTSKAVINLDVGKGVKLRGEAGSDGSTAGGVFFEKEY